MNKRVIVSAIIQKGDLILFGKKEYNRPPYPNVWHLPGGGVDDFEKAIALLNQNNFDDQYFHNELQREVLEETGLEIANIRNVIPGYRKTVREMETENKHGEMTHYYFLEYLCDYKSGEAMAADDLDKLEWFNNDEIRHVELTKPSQELFKEIGII